MKPATLEELIEVYGSADKIPDSKLTDIGWERKGGDIVKFDAYAKSQQDSLKHITGRDEYGDENSVFRKLRRRIYRKVAPLQIGNLNLPKEVSKEIVSAVVDEFMGANSELFGAIESGYVPLEEASICQEELDSAKRAVLNEKAKSIKDRVKSGSIPKELVREFEEQYGPISTLGQVPFTCYVLQRDVLGVEKPEHFW